MSSLPSAAGRYERVDWYALPRYYDIVNEQGTREEADYLEAVHERARAPSRGGQDDPGVGLDRDVQINVDIRMARGVSIVGNTFWKGGQHNLRLVERRPRPSAGFVDQDRCHSG